MNKFIKFKKIVLYSLFLFCLFIFSLFVSTKAEAATFYFSPPEKKIGVGSELKVSVFLDAESQPINAVEGEIIFPANSLELKSIIDGDSIVDFWLQKPEYQKQKIVFSGIIPGGFLGTYTALGTEKEPGKLFSFVIKAKKADDVSIALANVRALLNDGLGTAARASLSSLSLKISDEGGVYSEKKLDDSEPPEAFDALVAQDASIFNGEYFLIFSTQDKLSGIDSYYIYESKYEKEAEEISEKNWDKAESPRLLKDQNLESFVYIKAMDKDGNERISVVFPQKPDSRYEKYFYSILLILGIILFILFVKKLLIRKTKN